MFGITFGKMIQLRSSNIGHPSQESLTQQAPPSSKTTTPVTDSASSFLPSSPWTLAFHLRVSCRVYFTCVGFFESKFDSFCVAEPRCLERVSENQEDKG